MRRVTIRDVAAEARVSIGTASKALNGQGKLRAETRERVAEVAQRLGFAPNTLAQALLAGRSFTVGLITTDSFGRFSIPVMLGAEDALGTGQVSVFMCDTRDDPGRERRYVEMLAARRVDGLIVTGRRIEPRPPVLAGPASGRVRDDPADGRGRPRGPARRRGRRTRRRRAPAPGRPAADRAHHRPGTVPGRADARGRVRRRAGGGRPAAARRRAVRRVERALGPGGGRPAARRGAGH